METFSDKTRAFLYALMVHLAVFALLFIGLLWTQNARPVAIPGPVIDAEIVGPVAAPRANKPKPAPPKPVQPPEPPKPPEEQEPPPTVQRNDNKEQEKVAEIAEQKAEQAKREQEEKHRQQQILLDEEKKRQEAEAKERQKKLDKVHAELLAAAKQTRKEQEKMNQLDKLQSKPAPAADVPEAETAKTGMNGADTSLLAEYSSAIVKVVTDNWNRPDTVQPGLRCAVHVIQLPGGTVMSAKTVSPCNADQIAKTSIEQAVTKAQPLPYKGYESVFQRDITFIFKYDGN